VDIAWWKAKGPIHTSPAPPGPPAAAIRLDVEASVALAARFAADSPFPEGLEALEDVG
jgi:hypothetical protein